MMERGGTTRPRLDDALDVIRQEYEAMAQEVNVMRAQRDDYEAKRAFLLPHSF